MDFWQDKKVGLALGGGAAKGLAHIGVLRALTEAGIQPAVISGTSMGALIGGLLALGMSWEELAGEARQVTRRRTWRLLRPALRRSGLIAGQPLLELLREYCGEVLIEDLPRPFVACAVDFSSGRTLYIDRGPLVSAIRASIAVPGLLEPLPSHRTLLVDGGLTQPVPLEILYRYDPDFVIGVNVLKTPDLRMDWQTTGVEPVPGARRLPDRTPEIQFPARQARNLRQAFLRALEITLNAHAAREVQRLQPDLMIEPDMSAVHLWEFWKAREAIAAGYAEARRRLSAV